MTKNNDKNNLKLKAVFRLFALFVYIQVYLFRRLSRNHNSCVKPYRFPIFASFVYKDKRTWKIYANMLHRSKSSKQIP